MLLIDINIHTAVCNVNITLNIFTKKVIIFINRCEMELRKSLIKVHLSRIMGEQKLKIADVARMTDLHRNGITKLYNEETDGIKFETLEKLCLALNCDISDLLEIISEEKAKY